MSALLRGLTLPISSRTMALPSLRRTQLVYHIPLAGCKRDFGQSDFTPRPLRFTLPRMHGTSHIAICDVAGKRKEGRISACSTSPPMWQRAGVKGVSNRCRSPFDTLIHEYAAVVVFGFDMTVHKRLIVWRKRPKTKRFVVLHKSCLRQRIHT